MTDAFFQLKQDLAALCTPTGIEGAPRLIVITGDNETMRVQLLRRIREWWQTHGGEFLKVSGKETNEKELAALWGQGSLFDMASLIHLREQDFGKDFSKILAAARSTLGRHQHLVLEQVKEKKEISKLWPAEAVKHLVCPPEDAKTLVPQIDFWADFFGCRLHLTARRVLAQAYGTQTLHLVHCLQKLQLIYAGCEQELSAPMVEPHLSSLNEAHVFALFHDLRERKYTQAEMHLDHFVDRGESALALLGILAKWGRGELTAPPSRWTKNAGGELQLRGWLHQCQKADIKLKSSGLNESLVLSQVIEESRELA